MRFTAFTLALAMAACVGSMAMSQDNASDPPAKSENSKKSDDSVLNHTIATVDGEEVNLADYKGKVLLVVNVASKCGHTPQYSKLEALYGDYKEKGLEVLAFPCNQFGKQEPGSNEQIKEFCTSKYDVSFPIFTKIDVNDDKADPFYQELTSVDTKPKGAGPVSWNFEKFLIGKDGKVLARYASAVQPDDKELVSAIEKALAH